MAEDNKSAAQSKLGELFVDIGSSGLGTLLKGLNSLSASFLLTKNAASQFIKPIFDISQQASKSVVTLDKIRSVTGLTVDELQRLEAWTGLNNIDFHTFIGQIQNAQQKIMDVRTGMLEAPAGLSRLGLTAFEFDAHDPLGFLNTVMNKVKQVDEVTGSALLRWLGLSEDLLYSWDQGNQKFDERLFLNEQELENLREQQAAWNTLKVTVTKAFSKWISQQTDVNKGLTGLADNTGEVTKMVDILGQAFKNVVKSIIWACDKAYKLYRIIEKIFVAKAAVDASIDFNGDFLTPKERAELKKDPERLKKYNALMKKYQDSQKKVMDDAWQEGDRQQTEQRAKYATASKKAPVLQYTPNKTGGYSTPSGAANNGFGVQGSLLSPTPIDDYSMPAAVNGNITTPLPATANTNNVSNNISFQINQNITGDNAEQIAQASADAIDNASLNILQAQNQWAV